MSARKNEPGGRSIRHVVRVTPAQEKLLQMKANATSVTVSRLLLEAALGSTPAVKNTVMLGELSGIRRQIAGEANNLNQLVRDANSGTVFETDIRMSLAAIETLNERLNQWLSDHQ